MDDPKFQTGDRVQRKGSDYHFPGIVVARFRKATEMEHDHLWRSVSDRLTLTGQWRYVIQDDRGTLFIQSDKSLEKLP